MHRSHLLEKLSTYADCFPEESMMTQEIAAFVKQHTDCFERTLLTGHVTGSAWVVNKSGTHVLLTHHKKLDRWLQLGGHADGESDILSVAMREAKEESGIKDIEPVKNDVFDIDIHLIPERKKEPAHYHYDVRFAFRITKKSDYVVSDESHDLAWVPIEHLREYSDEASMLRMREKWLSWNED